MNELSLQYLNAMNISVWQLRKPARLWVVSEKSYTKDALILLHEMLLMLEMEPCDIEMHLCTQSLAQHIEGMAPRSILILGEKAAQSILNTQQSLSNLRGALHYYGNQKIPVIVTHHPEHLLKVPKNKVDAMHDLHCLSQIYP